jgi:predicted ribonuclease YlaK
MNDFYSSPDVNKFDLYINQYLLIYNKETGECIDQVCWTGAEHRHLTYGNFTSHHFGDVKPMKGDIYQALAADSLINNKITLIKGPAGSGKTYLSLGYLIHKLERHRIDKIIVFCNTVATKNSAKMGFYPGTRDEKLLDSQIGNLLISKFGGRIVVEQMINEEKLVLLPLSDIRGYDTSGMRAGIYISEAQNLDIDLMKLTLQRIGDDSICIIDGDCKTQVDDVHFAGSNNGMRRASEVFRGSDIYGEITLKNIHRSKIALLAEEM